MISLLLDMKSGDRNYAFNSIGECYGTYTLTLPTNAWVSADNSTSDYKFICDVEETEASVDLIPVGVCLTDYFKIADKAGLMNGCETKDGYIRFYAKQGNRNRRNKYSSNCRG